MPEGTPFAQIINDLHERGYSVNDGLLTSQLVAELAGVTRARQSEGRLVQASTGTTRKQDESLRGDSIFWLEDDSSEGAVVECLAFFEQLRLAFNQHLFLSLHEVETHLAMYPAGAIYKKHIDQFATGEQHRQISMVLYLNDDWLSAHGGELRLYLDDDDGHHKDILPIGGRLVLFRSEQFWHEVLPASRERLSLTGWFRSRSSI